MRKLILAAALAAAGAVSAQDAFRPPPAVPALASALAARYPLHAVAAAGPRLVAVGPRGHILHSDDGQRWTQAVVPVSSDLLAVQFPTPRLGWAVGHDGVVLHSADAGATWAVQLDGQRAAALVRDHYRRQVQAGVPGADAWLKEGEALVAQGADKPFLDLWFEDERRGFVVGAFNLILRTEDGGRSWTPWLDRVDNPKALHLYGIRPAAGTLFMVGEQGLVLRLDAREQRFRAVPTPYAGSFFGLVGTPELVLAFGLRGNAWRSADGGHSWRKVETGVATGLTGGAVRADGALVVVSQAGDVLQSTDQGATLHKLKLAQPLPAFAAAAAGPGRLAIAGARGVRVVETR